MTPLVIIPARAGSKRLPSKNLAQIDGRSLLELAISQAWETFGASASIVVSTDISPEAFHAHGASFWVHQRPASLCRDETEMMDAVRDAVGFAHGQAIDFDCVVLLQPTSPLRSSMDILDCIVELANGADACISVVGAGIPELYTIGHAGRLRLMAIGDLVDGRRVVRPNGAVFAIKRAVLEAGKDWWTADVVTSHIMPEQRSVDIDTIYDLEEARRLWSVRK